MQNLIRATSETKVAQCGALGISLLAESVRNNDENAMYFGIFLAEAYAQKELQLIDTTYFKKELKQSVQVLKANPSIYTSMCGPFLNELSLALKK